MNKFTPPNTYIILVTATISALLGAFVMLYDIRSTPESINFINTSDFVAWFFINLITFALFPILGMPLWGSVMTYKRYFRREIIFTATFFTLLIALPDAYAYYYLPVSTRLPLAHAATKISIIVGVGFFSIGLPAAIVIWLIQSALRQDFNETRFRETHIEKYSRLRDDLALMILILGSIIGLLALATAALRRASISSGVVSADTYPIIFVLLYGAYFTFLLVIMYLPVYLSLGTVGNRICNSMVELPSIKSSKWSEIYSKRKDLQELLRLNLTDVQNWQSGLAILAPFIGGVISTLLEQ